MRYGIGEKKGYEDIAGHLPGQHASRFDSPGAHSTSLRLSATAGTRSNGLNTLDVPEYRIASLEVEHEGSTGRSDWSERHIPPSPDFSIPFPHAMSLPLRSVHCSPPLTLHKSIIRPCALGVGLASTCAFNMPSPVQSFHTLKRYFTIQCL